MKRELAIGPSHPVLVIAEIGINHDGSVDRAVELVRQAKKCGADAVKLQIFRADRLMHRSTEFAEYQGKTSKDASASAMLKRYELTEKEAKKIAAEAKKLGLWLLATPFSPGDLALVDALDVPAIKIASPDLVNKVLLREAAKLGRPLLLSTGAATMGEVADAVDWMLDWNAPFAMMHCISSYPTPAGQVNLRWINELREQFGVPIGFSDHTTETITGALAVAAGAKMIEKHLTYDRAAAGPDHAASLDAEQFAEYVWLIRQAEAMLGQAGKHVLEIERDVRRVSRQSLVTARAIAAGKTLVAADLTVQRPGTGIPAAMIDQLLGRQTRRALKKGEMVTADMFKVSPDAKKKTAGRIER